MYVKIIDLYTDFEIVSFENIEMTKLSKILGKGFSHDIFTNLDINDVGMVIIDDTVIKKPYSKENELIAYHYDNKF